MTKFSSRLKKQAHVPQTSGTSEAFAQILVASFFGVIKFAAAGVLFRLGWLAADWLVRQ